jgi:hypothetical protein
MLFLARQANIDNTGVTVYQYTSQGGVKKDVPQAGN